jgi:hypothetical protein
MGYRVASVQLEDGREFDRVAIVGGYITTVGEGTFISINEEEIDRIVLNHGK